jgi:hypothetical protein
MSTKISRAARGPSWLEVILGAVLSLILGVMLGAVLLALRPVVAVKEGFKEAERDPKLVYYVQGARDGGRAGPAAAKRKAFVEGKSVSVSEEELNALVATVPPANSGAAKPTEPGKAPSADDATFAPGALNFRIQNGALQVALPMTVNALGLSHKLIVQAHGGFVKKGGLFVYEPHTFYVGSCPVQKLPFLVGYFQRKFLSAQSIPDDVSASWSKLANVAIEGRTLKLTMP